MTVQTLQGEAQAAIWGVLNPGGNLDSTLATLGFQGLFDEVAEDQAFDYMSFGPTQELPDPYLAKQRAYIVILQLDIWSRKPGFKTAQAALARVNTLIDEQPLTLATLKHNGTWYNGSQQLRDNDEFATRHIAAKYKIEAQE